MITSSQQRNNIWKQIQKGYPGICQMKLKINVLDERELPTLAYLIRMNFPKSFYPIQVQQLDQLIQNAYYDNLFCQNEILTSIDNFTESEIQESRQQMMPADKFTIIDIKKFVTSFSDFRYVNTDLICSVSTLKNSRQEKATYQKLQTEFKTKPKHKNVITPVKSPKRFTKDHYQKQNMLTPSAPTGSTIQQIKISMGDKIPLQVKQMRSQVKKASQNSFAVSSLQHEKQKSTLELKKTQISLNLNKLAKANMLELFQEVKPQIINDVNILEYFVKQILQKCLQQPKMVEVYIEFASLFTKISKKVFSVNSANHLNIFHVKLTKYIQELFQSSIEQKKIKLVCTIIGSLIRRRKLSRKVFPQVLQNLLNKILVQKQKQKQQTYFESIFNLIISLGQMYTENWANLSLKQLLTQDICECLYGNNIKVALLQLAQSCLFDTTRIRCLGINLFESSIFHKQIQSISCSSNEESQPNNIDLTAYHEGRIKEILDSENGIIVVQEQLKNNSKMVTPILLTLMNGKKMEVITKTQQFLQKLELKVEEFSYIWKQEYILFIFRECDLPSMLQVLSLFIKKLNMTSWKITPNQNDQNYQQIQQFMERLSNKLAHC